MIYGCFLFLILEQIKPQICNNFLGNLEGSSPSGYAQQRGGKIVGENGSNRFQGLVRIPYPRNRVKDELLDDAALVLNTPERAVLAPRNPCRWRRFWQWGAAAGIGNVTQCECAISAAHFARIRNDEEFGLLRHHLNVLFLTAGTEANLLKVRIVL